MQKNIIILLILKKINTGHDYHVVVIKRDVVSSPTYTTSYEDNIDLILSTIPVLYYYDLDLRL